MIRAIIFDWHGVLDEVKLEDLIKKLAKLSQKSPEEVTQMLHTIEPLYALNTLTPELFWHKVQQAFALDDTQVEQAKKTILVVKKNQALWERIDQLRRFYRFAILSDCPMDKVCVIREEINLRDFVLTHFSAEKQLAKNSQQFFLNVVNELQLQPQDCLYVDDNMRHINTAALLGFQTCLFRSVDDLNDALKKQLRR